MGLWWLLPVSAFLYGRHLEKKKEEERREIERERQKRMKHRCKFKDGISEAEFDAMVNITAHRFRKKLIDHSIDGATIRGTVRSQSGITDWNFTVDFNDYGHLTGKYYWISRGNSDSYLPDRFADAISDEIKRRI